MSTQPVDRLTVTPAPNSARRFVDAIPVKEPTADSLKDLIARERPESENALVKTVLTVMTWSMYAVMLGAVILMIRAAASSYINP